MPTATLEGVEFKAQSGIVTIDEDRGIVECFVAAIGNKDSVNDIIVPGAFNSSLKRRKPRVVWGHNWNEPIGKVLEIQEVPSTDPRLPSKMRQAGVGGLYAKVQFNLGSERGREAFANVKFFGEEQEWSIGYKTIRKDYDPSRGANILQELELFEVSPVLHGANNLTGTVSIKSLDAYAMGPEPEEREEVNDAIGRKAELGRAVYAWLGTPVKVRDVTDDEIIYESDEKMYAMQFRRSNRVIAFGKPRRVRLVVQPFEEETEAKKPGCGGSCGCGHEKSLTDDVETKAGRVLSKMNLTKLEQARGLIREVITSETGGDADLEPDAPEPYKRVGPKHKTLADRWVEYKDSSGRLAFGSAPSATRLLRFSTTEEGDVKSLLEMVEPMIRQHGFAATAPNAADLAGGEMKSVDVHIPDGVDGATLEAVTDLRLELEAKGITSLVVPMAGTEAK